TTWVHRRTASITIVAGVREHIGWHYQDADSQQRDSQASEQPTCHGIQSAHGKLLSWQGCQEQLREHWAPSPRKLSSGKSGPGDQLEFLLGDNPAGQPKGDFF